MLKHIGTQQRLLSSCTPSLKPEMESYLNDHPHLLTALGLQKKSNVTQDESQPGEEAKLQPDLDKPSTPLSAEVPMLSPIVNTSINTPPIRNSPGETVLKPMDQNTESGSIGTDSVADQETDLLTHTDPPSNEVKNKTDGVTSTLKDTENTPETPEIPTDFLRTLVLKKVVHVNVSKDEVDNWIQMKDPNNESINSCSNTLHGLYFEKIGGRILRPRKRQYHADHTTRVSTSNKFYRGQCEDTIPQKM